MKYERNGKVYRLTPVMTDPEALDSVRQGFATVFGIDASAFDYLLQYGWSKSLQDSIAGRELKVRNEFRDQAANGVRDWAPDEINAAVESDLDAAILKRVDAIRNGTIRERGQAEPKDPLRVIAREMLFVAVKKAGKALPKEKEKVAELVTKFLAKYRDTVQAEYDRRRSIVETELTDLDALAGAIDAPPVDA